MSKERDQLRFAESGIPSNSPFVEKADSRRILITGASGFIGRHLVFALQQQDYDILAASRVQGSLPKECYVRAPDLGADAEWSPLLKTCDAVVHLAGRAHILNERQNAAADQLHRRVNVDGTRALARQAVECGVKHFIFISSIGAVTEASERMVSDATPCLPTTTYGKSKLEAEKALREVAEACGMAWTIIRPPLVYGPGNPGNMERLLKLVRSGIPLPLGSVLNRRSFIYVENLVDLIARCVANPKAFGKIYLPSDGEDVSTPELIRASACANAGVKQGAGSREHGSKSSDSVGDRETSHTPHTARHSARLFQFPPSFLNAAGRVPGLGALRKLTSSLYVDSEPLRRDLGWTPPFTMEEGLWRTWAKTQNS
jgi:nucleoside-diphosphate-sugar epimerase